MMHRLGLTTFLETGTSNLAHVLYQHMGWVFKGFKLSLWTPRSTSQQESSACSQYQLHQPPHVHLLNNLVTHTHDASSRKKCSLEEPDAVSSLHSNYTNVHSSGAQQVSNAYSFLDSISVYRALYVYGYWKLHLLHLLLRLISVSIALHLVRASCLLEEMFCLRVGSTAGSNSTFVSRAANTTLHHSHNKLSYSTGYMYIRINGN